MLGTTLLIVGDPRRDEERAGDSRAPVHGNPNKVMILHGMHIGTTTTGRACIGAIGPAGTPAHGAMAPTMALQVMVLRVIMEITIKKIGQINSGHEMTNKNPQHPTVTTHMPPIQVQNERDLPDRVEQVVVAAEAEEDHVHVHQPIEGNLVGNHKTKTTRHVIAIQFSSSPRREKSPLRYGLP